MLCTLLAFDISDIILFIVVIIAIFAGILISKSKSDNEKLLETINTVLKQNKVTLNEATSINTQLRKVLEEYSALNIGNELLKQRFEIKDLKKEVEKLQKQIENQKQLLENIKHKRDE